MDDQDPSSVVRDGDPDRFLSTLYAPAEKRDALLALGAFHVEVAAIRDRVREPLPGEIRLQWWRDAIETRQAGGHPLAEKLIATITGYDLPTAAFEQLLEARIFDLYADPMPGRTELEAYCGETEGAILQLACLVLDRQAARSASEASGHGACALGIARILARLPRDRARGQCFMPRDLLAAAGTDPESFVAARDEPAAQRAVTALVALATEHMTRFEAAAAKLPTTQRSAFLPLAALPLRLDRLGDAGKVLDGSAGEPPAWRRQWRIFRRASSGW